MAATIKACFNEIDQLQKSAYDIIDSIANAEYFTESEENPEGARSFKVRGANDYIRQIPDLLCVVSVALQNCPQSESRKAYYQEKYELYRLIEPSLKEDLKKAQLEAYKKENQAIHEQRLIKYRCKADQKENDSKSTDLFAGRSQKNVASKDETNIEDQITTHNKNITTSLKQTRQLMTMSVMQTELNIDSLDQQYKDLNTFNSKMIDMESILLKSRQIVKFIERQDKNDKRRIYIAIGFLLLCSAWVLWRRVLKTPFRILMWTLFKTLGLVNWITVHVKRSDINAADDASSGGSIGDYITESLTSVITAPTQTVSYDHYVQDVENILKVLVWEPSETETLLDMLNSQPTNLNVPEMSTTTISAVREVPTEVSIPVEPGSNVPEVSADETMIENMKHESEVLQTLKKNEESSESNSVEEFEPQVEFSTQVEGVSVLEYSTLVEGSSDLEYSTPVEGSSELKHSTMVESSTREETNTFVETTTMVEQFDSSITPEEHTSSTDSKSFVSEPMTLESELSVGQIEVDESIEPTSIAAELVGDLQNSELEGKHHGSKIQESEDSSDLQEPNENTDQINTLSSTTDYLQNVHDEL